MITQKKKKKLNPMLLKVLLISGGAHLAAILIFGSITVYKYIIPDEANFEEPPVVEAIEPPKEVKVEVRPQAVPQQQAMQNLRMRQVGNIAIANVDVSLPSMEQSFTVSSGLGGFGGGALLGGARGSIGLGMSDISVFGLKSRAERVLFVIDASRTMLTDEKGGLNSYRIIKEEINDMISNLSAGTLFNVAFYDNGKLQFFKERLVPAGAEATQALAQWIAPINADINRLGLRSAQRVELTAMSEANVIQRSIQRYSNVTSNENAYLSQVFLEQSADAIFVIAGRHNGFQAIRANLNARDQASYDKVVNSDKYKEYSARYRAELTEATKLAKKKKEMLDAERKSKGLPPVIFDGGLLVRRMGIKFELKHPNTEFGVRPYSQIGQREVEKYFRELVEVLYKQSGHTPPSINVVLFLAGDEKISESAEGALKDYTRFFDGKYRIIRGLDQIKNARSAKQAVN